MASGAATDLVEGDVPRRELSDLFDNEALWDADDTDEYILKIASELEVTHAIAIIAMRDAGGNSLLHMAAIWNRPKVVEALIRAGVELNVRNSSNQTALDLAMHYGNAELGLQLRHYGSKHTCESERDLAIAQRDLAQQQLHETDAELASALERLKHAKLEREAFRVERDRVAHTHSTLVADLESLVGDRTNLQQAIDLLQTEKQQLLLQLAQLKEALQCEQSTRQNAVQSWQLAQAVIAELQEREDVCREREEEALRVRNEALKDRDLALEQLRLAQLDQGIAKQIQLEAEREREEALKRLLAGEAAILAEKERWALKLAKVDEERRNIQYEINRQTTVLRTECERLETQLAIANNLVWNQREEHADKTTQLAQMESRLLHSEAHRERLEHAKNDLETRVQVLEDERRDEYKTWRDRIQESQRLAVVEDMHRMLTATISTWEAVANAHQQALLLDTDVFDDALKPMLATSLTCEKPATQPTITSSCSDRGLKPLLPALPSHSPVMVSSVSTPTHAPAFAVKSTMVSLARLEDGDFQHHFTASGVSIDERITSARAAIRLDSDKITSNTTAEHVVSLCSTVQRYLEVLISFVMKNLRHFRKQASTLGKMVERKDELITRFNHHRHEKQKKTPARLRECAYKPLF